MDRGGVASSDFRWNSEVREEEAEEEDGSEERDEVEEVEGTRAVEAAFLSFFSFFFSLVETLAMVGGARSDSATPGDEAEGRAEDEAGRCASLGCAVQCCAVRAPGAAVGLCAVAELGCGESVVRGGLRVDGVSGVVATASVAVEQRRRRNCGSRWVGHPREVLTQPFLHHPPPGPAPLHNQRSAILLGRRSTTSPVNHMSQSQGRTEGSLLSQLHPPSSPSSWRRQRIRTPPSARRTAG